MKESRWRILPLLLTLALVALKLSGEIAWSWVIVFAPIWLPAVFSVGLRLAAAAVLGALAYLFLIGGDFSRFPEVMQQIPLIGLLPWDRLG